MEITRQGKDRVASLEFAKELREFVQQWRATGKPEEQGQKLLLVMTAFTLADKTADEVTPMELNRFVDDHVVEINQAVDQALENLMCDDVERSPIQ